MGNENLHESPELLSEATKDMHRAIVSLMEELEAVDWYQQRAEACGDPALREVLLHNKNEEIEHAMMTLEWIRRQDPVFDRNARTYLFTEERIVDIEEPQKGAEGAEGETPARGPAVPDDSLGIGSLKQNS